MYNPNVCWRCGQVRHFVRDCPYQDPQPTKALGRLHHTLEAETPISRSLLNEFFNKLMRSERRQEIAKAKLKKTRQQLNAQANQPQAQVGGVFLQLHLHRWYLHLLHLLQLHPHLRMCHARHRWEGWPGWLNLNQPLWPQ